MASPVGPTPVPDDGRSLIDDKSGSLVRDKGGSLVSGNGPFLVTGGAGFIGSHIVDRLLSEGGAVVVLDSLDDYYDPELKRGNLSILEGRPGFTFVQGDIRDRELVDGLFVDHRFKTVYHEAAQAGVRISVEDPFKPTSINIEGTLVLLEAAVKHSVTSFINASSSSVYGTKVYLPFDEKHPRIPVSPYGVTKMATEDMCRVYTELHGLRTICLRYFTVYGPRMRPDLAMNIFTKAGLKGDPITIFGTGEKTRDFTYVDDIVEANIRMLEGLPSGNYNIGYGSSISVNDLAARIVGLTGGKSDISHADDVKGDAQHTLAETTLIREGLGWTPSIPIEEGLGRYVSWVAEGCPMRSHWA